METNTGDTVVDVIDEFIGVCCKIRFSNTRSTVTEEQLDEKLNKVINIIAKDRRPSYQLVARGLIYYPNVLKKYIKYCDIDKFDLGSMICRCIEHTDHNGDVLNTSLDILFNYIAMYKIGPIKLMLLQNKYQLNYNIYNLCKSKGIHDEYLDDFLNGKNIPEYEHDLFQYDYEVENDTYFGYRNIYIMGYCMLLLNVLKNKLNCGVTTWSHHR